MKPTVKPHFTMTLYHPHFGVPELAALNSRQRRVVWRAAVYPASMWFRPLTVVWVLLAVFVVAPWGQRITGHLWGAMVLGGLAVGLFGYLEDRVVAWVFRGRVRQFIRDHEADIRSAA